MQNKVPRYETIMWPTLKALEKMGGSASIYELNDIVAEVMHLSDEILEIPHIKGSRSSFEYKSAWARTHLKFFDAVENSERGVWAITEFGRKVPNEKEVLRLSKEARALQKREREKNRPKEIKVVDDVKEDEENDHFDSVQWEEQLLSLLKEMNPSAFERLCQRLLREAGFSKVEVTGKSGDGGIDGVGVLKVNLLSFHVRFQCKRYAGSVSSGDIRNFRGAMQGRADKGLFITTGRYTKGAEGEAIRDGAPAIDLIDGMELCQLLKKFGLGIRVETVEEIKINDSFYVNI